MFMRTWKIRSLTKCLPVYWNSSLCTRTEVYYGKTCLHQKYSTKSGLQTVHDILVDGKLNIRGESFLVDNMTNITPRIISLIGRNLHLKKRHPLYHLRQRIIKYMYSRYCNGRGNPKFSIHDQMSPIVSTEQNFDSLLIPEGHISRSKSDSYYLNSKYLMRTHTSAHQLELMKMGLDNFIVMGDVYRRDSVDKSHFPIFHQAEGVRLCSNEDIFGHLQNKEEQQLFEKGERTKHNQGVHTEDAIKYLSYDLKACLEGLALNLFGKDTEIRWVDAYFPFTHPSWELEVLLGGEWLEILGCGIIEQEVLYKAGAANKIGWAFGLGLERWAMALYQIPDIRLFWSQDIGFAAQFDFDDPDTNVQFKSYSDQNPVYFDISFWLPTDASFNNTDFYDLVHSVGENLIEHVKLVDEFKHPKTGKTSVCFRMIYRHPERTLTKDEVRVVHSSIEKLVEERLGGTLRIISK